MRHHGGVATRSRLVLVLGDRESAALVRAERRIILAKATASGAPNVAWLVLEPAPRIVVEWRAVYGLYASETGVHAGAVLDVLCAILPARDRVVYPFALGGFRRARSDARIPHGHYDVWNAGTTAATFGLLQSARVNGRRVRGPVNAVVLPAEVGAADFKPADELLIWLDGSSSPGSVIDEVPADAAALSFRAERDAAYRYDPDARRFVPVASFSPRPAR